MNNYNEEIIDVTQENITSQSFEVEYNSKHYLQAIIIYFLSMYIGASFIQTLLIMIYPALFGKNPTYEDPFGNSQFTTHFIDFANLWTQILVYGIIFTVLVLILKNAIRRDFARTKNDWKFTLKKVGLGIVYVYVASYACNILLTLLQITQDSENQDAIVGMLTSSNSFAIVLYILVLVILAPIVEELIFRKAMFGYMKKFNLSKTKKILISGIIFGGIHVATAILSMIIESASIKEIITEVILGIPYCVMGIILSYTYADSDENMAVPTLIHMFNNALSVISIYLLMNLPE